MHKLPNIALGHQARVGKDTVADFLVAKYGYTKLSFAAPVYEAADAIQKIALMPRQKDPRLLQFIGQSLRELYSADIWLNIMKHKLQQTGGPVVISDMRYPNEADFLKNNGFIVAKICRTDRPIDRDPNHPSETSLADYDFHYTISNDGTIDELFNKIVHEFKLTK